MNQGRIWCVVNPTVGLPLFLGSVAAISLIVHASVLSHSTWFGKFFEGAAGKAKVAEASTPAGANTPTSSVGGYAISVQPVSATANSGATSFVITVTPSGSGPGAATTAVVAQAPGSP